MINLNSETIRFLVVTAPLALLFTIIGAVMVGLSYARRNQKFSTGALIGAIIGLSIILMIMGGLGIAASSYGTTLRLASILVIGIGLLLIAGLAVFGPRRSAAKKSDSPNVPEQKTQPTLNVFISYRRDDTPDVTGRIYDVLVEHYGPKSVFKDVDSIPFGVDFRKHLQSLIEQCDVVLVIIGDRWLNITDSAGAPRLNNQADFVRIEVESALQHDLPIVPVLVKGSVMPNEGDLPESIKGLAYRNGITVRYDPDFHHDMERLIRSLDDTIHPSVKN